jgi:hypothetical protein
MPLVRWLVKLGTTGAASNAAAVLNARHRAEAQVDAAARRLVNRVPHAA